MTSDFDRTDTAMDVLTSAAQVSWASLSFPFADVPIAALPSDLELSRVAPNLLTRHPSLRNS